MITVPKASANSTFTLQVALNQVGEMTMKIHKRSTFYCFFSKNTIILWTCRPTGVGLFGAAPRGSGWWPRWTRRRIRTPPAKTLANFKVMIRWWGRRVNFHGQLHACPRKKDTNELWTRHDIVMVFQLRSCFGVEKYQVSVTASWFHHMVPIGCPIRWNPSPRPMSRRERSCTSPPVSLHPSRLSGCYSPPADPRWKPRLFTSYRNGAPR